MKKLLIITLVLLFVPVIVFAGFSDVENGHWAYSYISELKARGVIDGYEDGTFRPGGNVTRAEISRMLCDIASLPEGNGAYADVSQTDWFYTYARDCGQYIEEGNEFRGESLLTREELASAIVLIKGLNAENDETAQGFSDCEDFEKPAHIAAAVNDGFISGYEDGSFRPLSPITRAEVCSMLVRAFPAGEDAPEPEQPGEKEEETVPKTWSLTRLANADLEDFSTQAVLGYYNEIIFFEDEAEEILFKIDLSADEIKRETMWRFPAFFLRPDKNNEESGYSGFIPHSLFFDNESLKTIIFGRFTLFKDKSGTTFDVNHYSGLDITYRLFDYAQFEEGRVQYEDKETCIPKLLYVHNEKYSVVYDGKNSVYMFRLEDGLRQGRLYYGKPGTYRGFLSIGERMFGVDGGFNLKEYDFENMEWKENIHTFDADFMGIRESKFWLWDAEGGRIYTSSPDGRETTVHENVSILNVEIEEGLENAELDGHMLVYDEDTFILYDGKSLLKLEKK